MKWFKDKQKTVLPGSQKGKTAPLIKEVITDRLWEKGEIIDGLYEVKDNTLHGSIGRVYIVEHLKWKILLAVKSPLPHIVGSSEYMSIFVQDAQVWVDLGIHPHIANCFYVRQVEGLPRIFVEYVDGGDLKQWVSDGKTKDWDEILNIVLQVCQALIYAHKHGVVHRDIKPDNCLIAKDGTIKVTDFSYVEGTPEYMPPEQFENSKEAGKEADIYAFGIMLFEICCGRRPFVQASDDLRRRSLSYKIMHLTELPPDPKGYRPDMPDRLRNLVLKCLEKKPENRFSSFGLVYEELTAIYSELLRKPYKPIFIIDEIGLKADSWNNWAISYLDLGMEEKAIQCWQQALAIDPQHLEATVNLGYLEWEKGKITDDVYLKKIYFVENAHNEEPAYFYNIAKIHLERGALKEAKKFEAKAEKLGLAEEKLKLFSGYDPLSEGKVIVLEGHTGYVNALAFLDNRHVISGSGDGSLRLWDLDEGKCLRIFRGHNDVVFSVALCPDGKYAVSGSGDKTLRLWDLKEGRYINTFEGHSLGIYSVAVSPDGRCAISGSGDKTLRLWDIAKGNIKIFEEHEGAVLSLAFSPNGRYVLSGSWDCTVRIWDLKEEICIIVLKGHAAEVTSVAFSPDGKYALSGGGDKTIRLWDVKTGRCLGVLNGHTDKVNIVLFSADGRYAISGGSDKTVRLWYLRTGRCTRTFEGHTDSVLSLAISPIGKQIVSGSADRTLRVWYTDQEPVSCFQFMLCKPVLLKERFEINARVEALTDRDSSTLCQTYPSICTPGVVLFLERARLFLFPSLQPG